jgi:hypothetical protein
MEFYMKLVGTNPPVGRNLLNTEKVMFITDEHGNIEGKEGPYSVEVHTEFTGASPTEDIKPQVRFHIGTLEEANLS